MATYKVYDDNGRVRSTIIGVLAPVPLAGIATDDTTDSNIVTVTSTANLYPGMAVAIPNIPSGAFIHAIISTTQIELWRSDYSTAGAWTTTGANADATVTATGGSGYAYGFSPLCQVSKAYAMGTWRNTIRSGASIYGPVPSAVAGGNSSATYPGLLTTLTVTGGPASSPISIAPAGTTLSDEALTTPVKRHNGEYWGMYLLVSTGGLQTLIHADPSQSIVLTSVT